MAWFDSVAENLDCTEFFTAICTCLVPLHLDTRFALLGDRRFSGVDRTLSSAKRVSKRPRKRYFFASNAFRLNGGIY